MKNIILHLYPEYGRYISRFRGMPFNIDCLLFVERRLLLTLYKITGKTNKLVKAAKIVGDCLGELHPHGDKSCYDTLVKLAHLGFVDTQGNWGCKGLTDSPAAPYRYTECRIKKWVTELAFKYINYVPWETPEFQLEPLALPCPVPVGLIGNDIITGISFYKMTAPRYKFNDLVNRLLYLLGDNNDNPIIKPFLDDCIIQGDDIDFLNILTTGIGSFKTIPYSKIIKHKNKDCLSIMGRSPNTTFTSLISAFSDSKKQYDAHLRDGHQKIGEYARIIPAKKNTDFNKIITEVFEKYLISNINIQINVCNTDGLIEQTSIDQLLINNYQYWRQAVFNKLFDDCIVLIKKHFSVHIELLLKNIIKHYYVNNINDILTKFKELDDTHKHINSWAYDDNTHKWVPITLSISDQDVIDTYNDKKIKQIIESNTNISKLGGDIIIAQNKVYDIDNICLNETRELLDEKIN